MKKQQPELEYMLRPPLRPRPRAQAALNLDAEEETVTVQVMFHRVPDGELPPPLPKEESH